MGNFVFPFLTMLLTIKLGYSKASAGVFMSVISLLAGVGVLSGGKLGDTFGRKRTIAVLQVTASAIMAACALLGLVPVVPFLIAGAYVLLQASWPIFNALVADLTAPKDRKRSYALLYWGNNIGFSIGPLMAGYLFSTHTELMFMGNAVSLLIVSILLSTALGNPGIKTNPTDDTPDNEQPETGSLLTILRRRPLLWAFAGTNLLLQFVYSQQMFGLPIFLNETLGTSGPTVYGTVMTTNGLTVVLCTAPLTALLGKRRPSANLAIAALLYALGFGMLFLAVHPLWVLFSTIVWTWGEIVSATNIQVFIAAHSPSSHRGRVNGFISWVSGLGAAGAPLLGGAFVEHFGSRTLWPFVSVLAVVAGFLLLRIARYDGFRPPLDQFRKPPNA
jgi:MFS family permease